MFGSFWVSRRASFRLDRKRLGNGLIMIVKIMLMTMMKIKMIITIEKREAYHLVPKSILSYFIGEYKGNLECEHCLGFSSIF